MKIPHCLPLINDDVIDEVHDTLTNTGWLTTGPKVELFQNEIKKLTNAKEVLCVNSWTSGAMLALKWYGIGKGDEVIIPAYTYAATALCVMNLGAKPVMIDVKNDFTIDEKQIDEKINSRTKAIIPVDLAGLPCSYNEIYDIINKKTNLEKFEANNSIQKKLNRILVLSDAAHSIGAKYFSKQIGSISDITVFSFHSVKNITTGEGGAVCLNLPQPFSNLNELNFLKILSLNGQNKSALEKNKIGSWKYDISEQGLKVNMPDICAAIGLSQIKIYKNKLLPERKSIFEFLNNFFEKLDWAIIPPLKVYNKESSCHLYLLRFKKINEHKRDLLIQEISKNGVGVNVHYIPLPMHSLFKKYSYNIKHFDNSYNLYKNLITLPLYNGLKLSQLEYICNTIKTSYEKII